MFPADVSIIGTRIITFYIYESICTARDYTNESSVIPVAMAMSDNIVRQPAALTRNTHNNRCSRLRNPLTAASSDCKEVDENRFGAQSYCFGRYKKLENIDPAGLERVWLFWRATIHDDKCIHQHLF